MQINRNIKLIRELSGKKQSEFAELIKTNLSNLKTYENSDVRPKANVIAAISDLTGVTVDDLDNKKLTHKDICFKPVEVEKVEVDKKEDKEMNDLLCQLMKQQNKLMEMQNKLLEDQTVNIMKTIVDTNQNVARLKRGLQAILDQLDSASTVALRSLARLEKKPDENSLLNEQDFLIVEGKNFAHKSQEKKKQGKHAVKGN